MWRVMLVILVPSWGASLVRNEASHGAAHHDTKVEACSMCAKTTRSQTCFAGDCGDGSNKFCWCPKACGSFEACE